MKPVRFAAIGLDHFHIHAQIEMMLGQDNGDPASQPSARLPIYRTATESWPLAPMFTFVKTHAWDRATAETREAFGELVEQLGSQVTEISISHTTEAGCIAARTVNRVELAHQFGPLLDTSPDLLHPVLVEMIEDGRRITGTDYVAALNAREQFHATVEELLLNHGTILTPSALGVAPEGLDSTGDPVFCAFWTYLGTPSLSMPLFQADGMPMGVQLVGSRGDDGRLLRTANGLLKQLQSAAA